MSNTYKLFAYAGWSLNKGKWKLRFANDAKRERHLVKFGHENLVMVELPRPMTKMYAARYLFADTNLMESAPWRNYDSLGENHPSLDSAEERNWYFQHWLETHPEEQY